MMKKTPIEPARRLLATLLWIQDGTFAPMRTWERGSRARVTTWEARGDYREGGLPFKVPGDTGARKRVERLLTEFCQAELIEMHRPGGRHPLVKLTAEGDQIAREAAGLFSLGQSLRLLATVAAASAAGFKYSDDRDWVPEIHLPHTRRKPLDYRIDGSRVYDVALLAMPCLVRGLLDTTSQLHGEGWYALTPEGQIVFDEQNPRPYARSLPEIDYQALTADATKYALYSHYLDGYDRRRDELKTMTPRHTGELGLLRLPGGIGLDNEPDADDLDDAELLITLQGVSENAL